MVHREDVDAIEDIKAAFPLIGMRTRILRKDGKRCIESAMPFEAVARLVYPVRGVQ